MPNEFRNLPSVDKLLSENAIVQLQNTYPHTLIVEVIRHHLEQERHAIAMGKPCPETESIVVAIRTYLQTLSSPRPRPVINATGVIIHTNIGRAPLSAEPILAMNPIARGYSDLAAPEVPGMFISSNSCAN